MVVDDDRVCRLVVHHQLALLALPTFSVASCGLALTQAALRRPDVVLLDTCLPDGDGYSLARALTRQALQAGHSPAFLVSLSGRDGVMHRQSCIDAGIDAVLPKPASIVQLASALGLTVNQADGPTIFGPGTPDSLPVGMLEIYRTACLDDLRLLRQAVMARDGDDARWFAHRLRGASACIGAGVVAAIASIFEPPAGACAAEQFIQEAALRWLNTLLAHIPHGDAAVIA